MELQKILTKVKNCVIKLICRSNDAVKQSSQSQRRRFNRLAEIANPKNMSTIILLARHGETAWNRDKIFRGTYDIPLNDTGKVQAKLLAQAFKNRKIDAVYTSPLSRAYQTAQLSLSTQNIVPVTDERLIDINYGDWTGKEDGEVAKQWPEEHNLWNMSPQNATLPNGETLRKVYNRTVEAMEEITSKHNNQTVAIFAHRVVNKLLVLAALESELDRFTFIIQDNCCLNEFESTNTGYLIRTINNTAHITDSTTELLKADF